MANGLTQDGVWKISADIGQPTTEADAKKTIKIATSGTYVDRDIWVEASSSKLDSATLKASAVASAEVTVQPADVSVANKTTSVTGKTQISASPATATTGIDKYYIAVNGTAAANTTGVTEDIAGTATAETQNSGFASAGITSATGAITGSVTAKTSEKTGSTYYIPIASGAISVSESANPSGYEENTSAVVPTAGSLLLSEGYYPKTFITLATLVPNEATITNDVAGASTMRVGTTALDKDGNLITGTMPNAVIKSGTLEHTLGTPTYNATKDNFNLSCTVTGGAPTVDTAGYISSSVGTKNAASTVTETHDLDKITGSISISGDKEVKPEISKSNFTISGVSDAAGGNATTTAPTSGAYVKVSTAKKTTNITASASISKAGYGTSSNNGISNSGDVAVGASASDATYIPIKSGSAAVTANQSISVTGGTPTYNSTTKKYDIALSGSKSIGGTATEGWVSSVSSANVTANGTVSLDAAAIIHDNTATEVKVAVGVSGTRSSNLANPDSDTTYYVTVTGNQTAPGSVSHDASVSKGYVPESGLSASATIATSASVSGNNTKIYLKSTAISNSLSGSIISSDSSTYASEPVLENSAPTGPYIDLSSSGSATPGAVYNNSSTDAHKYMKVFAGNYTIV